MGDPPSSDSFESGVKTERAMSSQDVASVGTPTTPTAAGAAHFGDAAAERQVSSTAPAATSSSSRPGSKPSSTHNSPTSCAAADPSGGGNSDASKASAPRHFNPLHQLERMSTAGGSSRASRDFDHVTTPTEAQGATPPADEPATATASSRGILGVDSGSVATSPIDLAATADCTRLAPAHISNTGRAKTLTHPLKSVRGQDAGSLSSNSSYPRRAVRGGSLVLSKHHRNNAISPVSSHGKSPRSPNEGGASTVVSPDAGGGVRPSMSSRVHTVQILKTGESKEIPQESTLVSQSASSSHPLTGRRKTRDDLSPEDMHSETAGSKGAGHTQVLNVPAEGLHRPKTHSIQSLFKRSPVSRVVKHVPAKHHYTTPDPTPVAPHDPNDPNADAPHHDFPTHPNKILVERFVKFQHEDEPFGVCWHGIGKGCIVVLDVVSGSPADRAGVQAGMRLVSIDGKYILHKTHLKQALRPTYPTITREGEISDPSKEEYSAIHKLRNGGVVRLVLEMEMNQDAMAGEGDDSSSNSSYDVEYAVMNYHPIVEAIWLPCLTATVAHTAFFQIPVIVHSIGLYWALLINVVSIIISMISLLAIATLLGRRMSPSDNYGPYHMLSRHVGTEYGGAVGLLFWIVLVLLSSTHAQGIGEAAYTYWFVSSWLDDKSVAIYITAWFVQFLIMLFVLKGVKYVSVIELIGVVVTGAGLLSCVAGLFMTSSEGSWKTTDSPSFDTVRANWIMEYDPTIPEASSLSVVECFCRFFPSSLGMLVVLGRATDMKEPEKDLPRGTVPAMVFCWTILLLMTFAVSFSLERDKQITAIPDPKERASMLEFLELRFHNTSDASSAGDAYIAANKPLYTQLYYTFKLSLFGSSDVDLGTTMAPESLGKQQWRHVVAEGYYYFVKLTTADLPKRSRVNYEMIDAGFLLSDVAYPHHRAFEILVMISLIVQCAQAMMLAPQVLAAMAADHVAPLLEVFAFDDVRDDDIDNRIFAPGRAIVFSAFMAAVVVPFQQVLYNGVTIIALLCLLIITFSALHVSLLSSASEGPSPKQTIPFWRPGMLVVGVVVAVYSLFLIHWAIVLSFLMLTFVVAKYLELLTDFSRWGEGVKGMQIQHALDKLIILESTREQSKNWRPQMHVLVKLDKNGVLQQQRLLSIVNQLKASRTGLAYISAVMEGDPVGMRLQARKAKANIKKQLASLQIVGGFVKVIVASTYQDGFSYSMQGSGIGALTPNTVVTTWPDDWKTRQGVALEFTSLLRVAHELSKAVLVIKGVKYFPVAGEDALVAPSCAAGDHIDLWWIVHDGGLELLIAFLLRQNVVWRKCELRIYTIIPAEDDSDSLAKELAKELSRLSIDATLIIHPVEGEWIREFTCTNQEVLEVRQRVMDELKLTSIERKHVVDSIVTSHHRAHSRSAATPISPNDAPTGPGGAHPPATSQPSQPGGHALQNASATWGSSEELPRMASSGDFGDFPMVDLVGQSTNIGRERGNASSGQSVTYHFECLNELIVQHSAATDLVLISLPDSTNFYTADEFMECMENMLKNISRSILIRGTGEQVITGY